jgi:hypothetical protein
MVLTSSGRSLHHAAAAPDSGCGCGGGRWMVVASEHRCCPRRRGEAARVIQLKASFNHTAVHSTPHRRTLCRFISQHPRQLFRSWLLLAFLITSFDGRCCLGPKIDPHALKTGCRHAYCSFTNSSKKILRNVFRTWILKLCHWVNNNSPFPALDSHKHSHFVAFLWLLS